MDALDPESGLVVGRTTVRAIVGDITTLDVDVIVNAANAELAHGGGVAAAIARVGGPVVDDESARWVAEHGPVARGQAAVTSGGNLKAGHVVHVVGPIHSGAEGDEADLRAAVRAALAAANGAGGRSVAMPAISAGIYGYPKDEATRVIAREVVAWLGETGNELEEVLLVGFDVATRDAFRAGLEAAAG